MVKQDDMKKTNQSDQKSADLVESSVPTVGFGDAGKRDDDNPDNDVNLDNNVYHLLYS